MIIFYAFQKLAQKCKSRNMQQKNPRSGPNQRHRTVPQNFHLWQCQQSVDSKSQTQRIELCIPAKLHQLISPQLIFPIPINCKGQ